MTATGSKKVRNSLGRRLMLIIMLVFGLYLLSASLFAYVIFSQYSGLAGAVGRHVERAMIAAELTRDAETIAAEVYELLVGNDRSVSAGNRRVENLASLYQGTRERLEQQGGPLSEADAAALDRWQRPFFSSLDRLNERLRAEQDLQAGQLRQVDELFLLLRRLSELPQGGELPLPEQRFAGPALAALGYAAAVLSAERPGHISRLQAYCDQQLRDLASLALTDPEFIALRTRLDEQLPTLFSRRGPLLRHARATLATARQTRVLAQKLTSATFGYHQRLKASAQQALQEQQVLMQRSLAGLLAASLMLVLITLGAIFYIRRAIIQRINRLGRAMQSHGEGRPVPIPTDGDDEISRMGATFEVFVKARASAEQQLAQANRHLQDMNQSLQRLSEVDELTQIPNRRCFDRHLDAEWRRAQREQRSLGLIMGDIDYFKRFNDEYGHQQGDECLHRVARALADQLHRQGDMVARYGGEEFIVLLPELDLGQTRHVAGRLLEAVRELNIAHGQSDHGIVTLSLGVVAGVPGLHDRIEDFVGRADKALYLAKKQGRNRLCPAPPECGAGDCRPG
ncbi:PleD protein [Oceanimonas sp. GK1]|uniref:GGDEF domain-containing protein n=1 Tax=Oceanimonas sp. (strain GK1 / IBRC-M 10197) TaxID=511062 RepID=UPI0002494F9E|nr:diguanylate cyclase [Oceanimonas sp. GK1]AEY02171.1 PleD protein [Oceanimonas sp. GK1]